MRMSAKSVGIFAFIVLIAFGVGGYLAVRVTPIPTPLQQGGDKAAQQAPAECLRPGPAPVAPDGATATAQEMALGHDAAQSFVHQLEHYQACRNKQADTAGADVPEATKQDWLRQGNDAIDEANAIADAFSRQLKIFKARQAVK